MRTTMTIETGGEEDVLTEEDEVVDEPIESLICLKSHAIDVIRLDTLCLNVQTGY